MPKLDKETREKIKALDYNSLLDVVLKSASKEKVVYDYLLVNYLDKQYEEKQLFDKTIKEINAIYFKSHKGFSIQLRLTNMLAACVRRINEFTKVSNNKVLEADLLMYLLKEPFSLSHDLLGTCFTQYDSKIAVILKRLINIVTKKLHEDYRVEYDETINQYLEILHTHSNHVDTVYKLPKSI